jgi:cytochrome b561
MIRNNSQRWGSVSIGLHWLTALVIIGLSIVGLIMTELPNSPFKMQVYALHKSFGLTVLALTLLRLAWRFLAGTPDDLPGSRLQQLAAKAVHGLMYFLLLAMPLSGWLFNSAAGFPFRWFNLVQLPKLFTGYNPALKDFAHELHETGFYLLAALLLVHAGAALFHHYVIKDDTLKRMTGKMP